MKLRKSPKLGKLHTCMICAAPAPHSITNRDGESGHFCQTHCLDAIRYLTARKGVK